MPKESTLYERAFLYHAPCPRCGSKDNLAVYDDGSASCFGSDCEYSTSTYDGTAPEEGAVRKGRRGKAAGLIDYAIEAIPGRRLTAETCQKWDYGQGQVGGDRCHVAVFRDKDGTPVAQKLRFAGKRFAWVGDDSKIVLFGQHLWAGNTRRVIVTEGEIDALSVSQAQDNKWPVVSVPNGATSAHKAFQRSLEWLSSFEEVVIMFDNDEPGQKAALKCAELLPPGKARIATLPMKDASDMLKAGQGAKIVSAAWDARVYRPDGIVSADDLWERMVKLPDAHTVPWPWPTLQERLRGLRTSELVTLCAGSGVGKSQVCRELARHLVAIGEKIGYIALEESVEFSGLGLLAIAVNRPTYELLELSEAERRAMEPQWREFRGKVEFFDHWGSIESAVIESKIRYMARALDRRWIFLDHVSIMVSGNDEIDDRKNLDIVMTRLGKLARELKIGIILVSHLKRPEGRGHEEGARVSLSHLRGTTAIGQLSNVVLGFERDGQDSDPEQRNMTTVRILKDRWRNLTGDAGVLKYDPVTGRMTEYFGEDLGNTDIAMMAVKTAGEEIEQL